MKRLLTLLCFVTFAVSLYAQYDSPESTVWDSKNKRYYISNAGSGTIVQWTDGTVKTFANGLIQPKAMIILDSTLYVCDYTHIKTYNINTAQIIDDVTVPGATFMNDMCVDTAGNFYITETYDNSIIKYTRKTKSYAKISLKGSIDKPNGIIYDTTRLIIVSYRAKSPIQAISLKDYQVTTIKTTNIDLMDGIQKDGKGNVYFSAWFNNTTGSGKVFKMKDDFTGDSVVAVSNLDGPADIFYNQETDTLVIPCMNGSSVIFIQMYDPPPAPKLMFPTNGVKIQGTNGLIWTKPRAAEKYVVEVSLFSDFQTILLSNEVQDTKYFFKTDQMCDTLYWRVKAINVAGESPWSEVRFLSPITSNPQTLVEPPDKLNNAPLGIKFIWNSNNSYARLLIDTLQDFSTADIVVLQDTTLYYSSLVRNKQYFWKVIGITCDEVESEVRSFTTANIALPSKPELLSPTKNEMNIDPVNPSFQWSKCDNTDYYWLYISHTYNYVEFEALDSIPATESAVITHQITDTLKPSSLAFWKIEAHNNYGKTVSESWVFNTKKIASVEENKNQISISPNPAKDYIEITYPLSSGGHALELWIFDIFGTKVQNNCQLSILNSQLKISVSHLAPGIYFIKIGDYIQRFVKI
jgi:hypothetical protein